LERDHKVFYENQSTRGFFGLEFSFQNYFLNLFSTSGLAIFEFVGQFFFQNRVFKLQEVFSELEIRVFLEN
jgi:hypothetical protein